MAVAEVTCYSQAFKEKLCGLYFLLILEFYVFVLMLKWLDLHLSILNLWYVSLFVILRPNFSIIEPDMRDWSLFVY